MWQIACSRAPLSKAILRSALKKSLTHYRAAQTRGASLREWRSVLENLEFIRLLVRSQWSKSSQSPVLQALTRIYRGLEFFVDDGEMESPPQSERQRSRRVEKKHEPS